MIVYFIPFVLLFTCYGTRFENNKDGIPNYFFFIEAASYFTYRILDEMDGKQARRTGNSSPLGLLFDHGCDAFTMGFVALTIAKTF
jgi:phosphatidylglycerophosphate synthase